MNSETILIISDTLPKEMIIDEMEKLISNFKATNDKKYYDEIVVLSLIILSKEKIKNDGGLQKSINNFNKFKKTSNLFNLNEM